MSAGRTSILTHPPPDRDATATVCRIRPKNFSCVLALRSCTLIQQDVYTMKERYVHIQADTMLIRRRRGFFTAGNLDEFVKSRQG